jgi:hypothetical protein
MTVWYSLWSFGIFFLIWYVWTKKYLATLIYVQTNRDVLSKHNWKLNCCKACSATERLPISPHTYVHSLVFDVLMNLSDGWGQPLGNGAGSKLIDGSEKRTKMIPTNYNWNVRSRKMAIWCFKRNFQYSQLRPLVQVYERRNQFVEKYLQL